VSDATWFFVHSSPSELVSAVSGSLKSISIAYSIAETSLHAYQVSTSSKVYANTHADSVSVQSWKLPVTGVWITSSRVMSICIAGNRWPRSFKTRFLRTSCSMLACLYAIEMVRICLFPPIRCLGTPEICLVVPASSSLNSPFRFQIG
jgi:hypothetical protein